LTVSDGTNSTTDTINIWVVDPDAPIINDTSYTPRPVAINKEITLTCTATDPGSLSLEYAWSASGGVLVKTRGESVPWKAPSIAGTYNIRVTVTNSRGLSDFDELNIPVIVPRKPVINSLNASPPSVPTGGTVDFACIAYDLDELPLEYTWQPGGGSFADGEGNRRTWTAPSTAGEYTVSVVVSNGYYSDNISQKITVN
jgi:hypothetical protein